MEIKKKLNWNVPGWKSEKISEMAQREIAKGGDLKKFVNEYLAEPFSDKPQNEHKNDAYVYLGRFPSEIPQPKTILVDKSEGFDRMVVKKIKVLGVNSMQKVGVRHLPDEVQVRVFDEAN